MLKPMTIHTLRGLVRDLKMSTLSIGRYPAPYRADKWDRRDKSAAFRCMLYNENVRRINALEDAISNLETE